MIMRLLIQNMLMPRIIQFGLKRKVKQGQRVAQGQVIGTVGSTGAATGPHLHYEFLMNGVHRNPRTVHKHLPKAKSLPADELRRCLRDE